MGDTISIGELALEINRKPHTIRRWDAEGVLPKHLRPSRGDRNRRYWTVAQVEGIKQWIVDEDRRPGKGLVNYKPENPDEIALYLQKLRAPRGKVAV